jgi:hypothetical protein
MVGFAHLFRPMYPDFLHGAPPTSACAAFIKESRLKFDNARELDRKSGVRSGEHGAPVPDLDPRLRTLGDPSLTSVAVTWVTELVGQLRLASGKVTHP